MANAPQSPLSHLRTRSIELNRAFVLVPPLVERTRVLSLNARLVAQKLGTEGGPFDVVAQSLGTLGHRLSEIVIELDSSIGPIVRTIAKLSLHEDRLHKFAAALSCGGGVDWRDQDIVRLALERNAEDAMRAYVADLVSRDRREAVIGTVLRERRGLLAGLVVLEHDAYGLAEHLMLVERAARVESFVIGVNARVEAGRLEDPSGGLASLADDIQDLCLATSSAVADATRVAKTFIGDIRVLTKPLRRELRKQREAAAA